MKTISLLSLLSQAQAQSSTSALSYTDNANAIREFDWNPTDQLCGVDAKISPLGVLWKVLHGKTNNHKLNAKQKKLAGGTMPKFSTDKTGVQYCTFDGQNDYLVVDKLFTEPEQSFTVRSKFRTTSDKNNNWSLLDCDRSEYFNLSLDSKGRVIFATSGNHNGKNHRYDDMATTQAGLNDGEWHTVTAIFNKGAKSIFIDGWLDASSLQKGSYVDYHKVGTTDGDGSFVERACFIADGSEATVIDGNRNHHYFEGDIASVQFYKGKLVIPNNPSFAYYPQIHRMSNGVESKSCASDTDYGWPVTIGAHPNGKNQPSAPVFGSDENLNYCAFNGVSDYLAVDKRHFSNAVGNFQIRAVFNTEFDGGGSNWALFDCDRSEFFHTSINKNGKIQFSTSGKNEKGQNVKTHDMMSKTKGLNDGNWHEVIFKYEDGTKEIVIDGVSDKVENDCMGGKCRTQVGIAMKKRFCFIGDGSEADKHDKKNGRNNGYYDGKIAVIDYVENGDDLPGTSPLDCHAPRCGEWDCKMWCKCYSEEYDDLYAKYNCDDDSGDECACGWNRHGGYLLEE